MNLACWFKCSAWYLFCPCRCCSVSRFAAETQYKGRTIICTWSENRAKKDKAEREEKIAKAKKMLEQPSNIEKKAKRYFLQNTGEKKYELDQKKIDKHVRFDGFKAIATNAKVITPQLALEKYKDLYKI